MTQIDDLREVQRALLRWQRRNGLQAPWRESGDPYHVLVAATMAQQTQMARVLELYERFLAAFPTLAALASATTGEVIRAWRGMGYNTRAVRLHRAAREIAADGWPSTAEKLTRIDGIGPFTAAIIASFAFGEPAACVDTNVRRVLGRLSGGGRHTDVEMQRLADAAIPRDEPARWNQALMDYGARVCVTRPKCDECVVSQHCRWFRRSGGVSQVAEPRAGYEARPKHRRPAAESYEGSNRWYRGRIIDALRELPPSRSIALEALALNIANGAKPLATDELRAVVDALAHDGLLVIRNRPPRGIQVALPD